MTEKYRKKQKNGRKRGREAQTGKKDIDECQRITSIKMLIYVK
jgi:hypothetical protein